MPNKLPYKLPYKFPSPADAEGWRSGVQQSVGTTLNWSRAPDGGDRWILSGSCPHCAGEMSQLHDLGPVVVPDTYGGIESSAAASPQVDLEIVCDCAEEHKKDTKGCGFGKGIKVTLARPSE